MRTDTTKAHRWNAADSVTSLRMIGSVCLLFPRLGSIGFYAVYTLTGLTDALDGWLARKTGTASDFGARLDSISDLLFYAIMLLRLFPALIGILPVQLWYVAFGVAMLRLAAYLTAAVKFHRFASLHTWLNKLTGCAVFLLPYVLMSSFTPVYCWITCMLGGVASVDELAIHLDSQTYGYGSRSFFHRRV